MSKMTRKELRVRRHRRVRKKISGSGDCPRMAVCCTGKNIYVQFVDDVAGHTLTSVSTMDKEFMASGKMANLEGATLLGKIAAERAKAGNITKVVFDRGGFRFHGRVKAIAEAAREAGLVL